MAGFFLSSGPLLDADEVARRLNLPNRVAVYRLCAAGELPCIRVGRRRLRVSEEQLGEFISRRRQPRGEDRG